MRVEVEWDLCESNALCMTAAQDVFLVDDDNQLQLLDSTPDASRLADVQRAVRVCPKRALRIVD